MTEIGKPIRRIRVEPEETRPQPAAEPPKETPAREPAPPRPAQTPKR
jgi:hypothetical protein